MNNGSADETHSIEKCPATNPGPKPSCAPSLHSRLLIYGGEGHEKCDNEDVAEALERPPILARMFCVLTVG